MIDRNWFLQNSRSTLNVRESSARRAYRPGWIFFTPQISQHFDLDFELESSEEDKMDGAALLVRVSPCRHMHNFANTWKTTPGENKSTTKTRLMRFGVL